MAQKRTLCVDFDGVIHSYTSGFQGTACTILDPPVPGAFKWLERMVEYEDEEGNTFDVCIYSSRSKEEGAISAMRAWFDKFGLRTSVITRLKFPTEKPPAYLVIDDRAFHFTGQFPGPQWIIDFKPWTKGGDYNRAEDRIISDLASRECETGEPLCICLSCRARSLIDSRSV